MEILRTSLTKQNLQKLDTIQIIDERPNSVYFNVYDIPNYDLGPGNHSFLIYGSEHLVRRSEIAIEMLDDEGQVIKTSAREDNDNSPAWRVSFTITPEHSNGLAEINIAGTAYVSEQDRLEQKNKSKTNKNVLWTKKVAVNTTLQNRSDIVFLEEPDYDVTFEEVSLDYKPEKFRSYGLFTFNDLETVSGKVETVELYYRLNGLEVSGSGDDDKWKLLSKIPVSASSGINVNSLSYRTEMPSTDYGEVYDFKTRYLNPVDQYAKENGQDVKETIVENKQQNKVYLYLEESLLTGSLYASKVYGKGIEISGMNSAYIRNVDYPGWDDAVATNTFGFLMFSGSVFPTSSNNYAGVGLELFGGSDAYLRFLTDPSLLEIATQTFYLGSDAQYISGSGGNIEISSSNFWLQPDGNVIISGSISASVGNIGGWGITDEYLISEGDRVRLYSSGVISASNFYISEGGNLTASNVLLDGNITASDGYFSASTIEYISGSELYFEQGTIDNFTASDSYLQTVSGSDLYFENGTIDTFTASNSVIENISGSNLFFEEGTINTFTASNSYLQTVSGSDLYFENGTINNFTASDSFLQTVSGSDLFFEQGSIDTFTASNSYLEFVSGSNLYFTNGTFDGKIVADVGEIGGWTISENSLSASNIMLSSLGIIQTKDYASGFSGWQIDQTGRAEFNEIIARGKITTAVFEKQEVNAVGGQLYIANSTILSSSVGASDTNLYVDNVTGFNDNEFIKIKYFSGSGTYYTEDMLITGSQRIDPTSDTDFTGVLHVERYKEHDGANQDYTYPKGNVIVSTGVVGSGYILNNANYDDNTPYIDFYERTGSAYNDIELKARIGDLYGLRNTDAVYGSPDPKFGLMATNVFLQGVIQAKSGSIEDMSGENLEFTNISSSNFYSENGFITNASGSNLHFENGTFDGKIQSETGEIGGWIIGSTYLSGANITMDAVDSRIYKSDDNNDNDGYYLDFTPNQGYYVRFGTNFAVSSSGQLIASGAVIEGVMTASAGYIGGWKIEDDRLITDGSPYFVLVSNEEENLAISAGATAYHNSGSAPFVVRHNGEVTASNVLLKEDITASGAYFSSSHMLESTIDNISGSDLFFEQGTIDTFTASNSYLQMVSGSELYFEDGTINNFSASNSMLTNVSGSGLHFENGTFSGKVSADTGDIAGWTINSTQIFKDPLYLDSDYQGFYIEDMLDNKIVQLANKSMSEVTSSANILLNSSFESGSSGVSQSVPDWYWITFDDVTQMVTGSSWGQDLSVHGDQSIAFYNDNAEALTGNYTLSQTIEGNFIENQSIYFLMFARAYSYNQEEIAADFLDQTIQILYSGSAYAGWVSMLEPTPFYVGKEFAEYSFIETLPDDANYIKIQINGEFVGSVNAPQGEPGGIIYDYMHTSVETPKVEMLPDGLLIYASPKSYIKLTSDGLDIKGGNNFDVNSISAGNLDIAGLLASNGAFVGATIPPYSAGVLDISPTGSDAGNVVNYARGNHIHQLTFSTIDYLLGTDTINDLYVDNLHASGSIILSGSNLEITGSLYLDDQFYAPSLDAGVDNSVLIKDSDGFIKTDEINSKVWNTSVTFADVTNGNGTRIAVFSDTDTINGEAGLTWDNGDLYVNGNIGIGILHPDSQLDVDGTIRISEQIYAPSLNSGVDNSVLIKDSDGYIKTDEIDSRVWGSSLVDYSGTPANNQIAVFSDTDTIEGDSYLTWDGERFTISDITGSLFEVSTNSEDEYISIDRIGTLRISSDNYPSIILQHTPLDYPFEIKALDNRLGIFNDELQIAEFNQDGTFILGNIFYSSSLGEGRAIIENSLSIGTNNIDNALTINGNISASGYVYFPNIGSGEDNSVLILDSDNRIKTDEIDSRVWGSTLVDGSGTANRLTYWTDANTIDYVADLSGWVNGTSNEINVEDDLDGTITLSIPFSSSLSNRVAINESDINDLQIDSGSFSTRITNNESDILDLQTDSGSFSTRITDNEKDISDLFVASGSFSTRVTTNETDISNLQIWSGSYSPELSDLTNGEIQQLQNINSITISNTQWSYLGLLNQSLTTTSNVEFANITGSNLRIAGTLYGASIGTGVDNSVLILDSDGYIKTDEIDSRVWGSTLLDATNGVDNRIATFTDSNSLNGEANLTFNGTTLGVTGNITVSGTVDDVDISSMSASYSTRISTNESDINNLQIDSGSFSTRVTTNETDISNLQTYSSSLSQYLNDLTDSEVQQLMNINSVTINNTQWGYLGSLDQSLATTDDVEFANITGSNLQLTSMTDGSVLFMKAGGIGQDNSDLFWDDANKRLGIGTTSPDAKLTVNGNISASAYIYAPNIGTGTDNSVLILDSDNRIKTDEINPIVWDTSATYLSSSNGANNRLAIYTSPDAIEGDENITWDGSVLSISGKLEATEKSFVINKPEGGKLEYSVLEGNQKKVYISGTLDNEYIISLPDEWKWLVDEKTISCTLTPRDKWQPLYINKIKNNKIYINIDGKFKRKRKIKCDYIVHAERKDIDKLNVNRD